MPLHSLQCQPCHSGAQPVSPEQATSYMQQLPQWQTTTAGDVNKLVRTYSFPAYLGCLEFVLKIGQMAEYEDHHPLIQLAWGKVTVEWWTHSISGLHRNDFILAARCDRFYNEFR